MDDVYDILSYLSINFQKFSSAVTTAFCRLYNMGLITREGRFVNWCCALRSTISDIEVDQLQYDSPSTYRVPTTGTVVDTGVIYNVDYQLEVR